MLTPILQEERHQSPRFPCEIIEQVLVDLWCNVPLSGAERIHVMRSLPLVDHSFRSTLKKLSYTHVYIPHPNYVREFLKMILVDRFLNPHPARHPNAPSEEVIPKDGLQPSLLADLDPHRRAFSPNYLCKSITIIHDLTPLTAPPKSPFSKFGITGGMDVTPSSAYFGSHIDLFGLFMDPYSTPLFTGTKRQKAHQRVLSCVKELSRALLNHHPDYVPNLRSLTIEFVDSHYQEIVDMQDAVTVPERVKELEIRILQNAYSDEQSPRGKEAGEPKGSWTRFWKEKVLSPLASPISQLGADQGSKAQCQRDWPHYSTHWCVQKRAATGRLQTLIPISIDGDSGEGRKEYRYWTRLD
ncbi:hypothetical protein AX16_006762 [Volvariella volvacea WC 439]|nr:hypothetical protein AX16_006762 [Volvariella volvacea WC 439]